MQRGRPVWLSGAAAMAPGGPMATTRPPASPPSGPRSMTQSAEAITSRLCSMTTTVLPRSTSRWRIAEQAVDVGEVQARSSARRGCRASGRRSDGPAELGGELDALGLAAGERRARLAERQVAQPDVVQRLEARQDPGHGVEERPGLVDAHLQHVADRLPLEADLQRLAVEPLAAALLAGDVQVGQEVHRDPPMALALAGLAPAPLDVEAEPARPVAADLGLAGRGEDPADLVEQARWRSPASSAGVRPIGAWSTSIELVDRLQAVDPSSRRRPRPPVAAGRGGRPGPGRRGPACSCPTRSRP